MRIPKAFAALAAVLALGGAFPTMAQDQVHPGSDAESHFKFLDTNKDGVLDQEEFRMLGQNYKEDFEKADTDKDGKVTLEEFKAYFEQETPKM